MIFKTDLRMTEDQSSRPKKYIKQDKTRNIYEMEKLHYEKLLQITSPKRINNLIRNVYNSINLEAKHLAKKT